MDDSAAHPERYPVDDETASRDAGSTPAGQDAGVGADEAPAGLDPAPGMQFVVLGWCLWLLGAWASSLWIDAPEPAARWMLLVSVIGLLAVWPAVRLSLGRGDGRDDDAATVAARARLALPAVFIEWLCLVLVFQAVIWPLRLVAGWSVMQAIWLDAAVVIWSLLVAAVVGWGCQHRRSLPRTLAMVVALALLLAEPVVMALTAALFGPAGVWRMRVSPFELIASLTTPTPPGQLAMWREVIMSAALATLVAWMVLAVTAMRKGQQGPPR